MTSEATPLAIAGIILIIIAACFYAMFCIWIIVAIAGMVDVQSSPALRSLQAMGGFFFAVSAFVSGAMFRAIGVSAHALRDIARNSFRH